MIICLHSVKMFNSSIKPIDRNISGATTLGQSGPASDGNEGVFCIPQSSSITRASPSDSIYRTLVVGGEGLTPL